MAAALLWFRNDLRLRDNQLFHYDAVRSAKQHVALYCIDPRHYALSRWGGPLDPSSSSDGKHSTHHARTGKHRARFLAESLVELERSLQSIGSGLLVVHGKPEHAIPGLLAQLGAQADRSEQEGGTPGRSKRSAPKRSFYPPGKRSVLAFQAEDTYEEQRIEKAVLAQLGECADRADPPILLQHKHHTLLNREDLGWDPEEFLPMPFGKFWHEDCQSARPREELPRLRKGDLPPPAAVDAEQLREAVAMSSGSTASAGSAGGRVLRSPLRISELAACMGFSEGDFLSSAERKVLEGVEAVEFVWRGGEAPAAERMREYATAEGLGTHMQTRNRFHGPDSFSRLSPWLANGCLSPRTVYWWLKRYFDAQPGRGKQGGFDHFHKYVFQLAWRDFFRFYCARFGPQVFFLEGGSGKMRAWHRDAEVEWRWKQGQTGVPIIDAFMREKLKTGYMSNRGRYTVASYLVFFLRIDWRVGADWFESLLIDHDVCSNYGEWASMANVAVDLGKHYPLGLKGRGPSDNRDKGRRGGGGDPWASGASAAGILPGDAVFCPYEQATQYDKKEEYVRRWVPELRDLPAGTGQAHRPPLDCAPVREGRYPRPLAAKVDAPLGMLGKVAASVGEGGCGEPPLPYGRYYRHRVLWADRAGAGAEEGRPRTAARRVVLLRADEVDEAAPSSRQDAAGAAEAWPEEARQGPTRRWRKRGPAAG